MKKQNSVEAEAHARAADFTFEDLVAEIQAAQRDLLPVLLPGDLTVTRAAAATGTTRQQAETLIKRMVASGRYAQVTDAAGHPVMLRDPETRRGVRAWRRVQ